MENSNSEERRKTPQFEVIILGIILDSSKKKILIGKRKSDDEELLEWCFPGGRLSPGQDIDHCLKEKIKLKTGYSVKNVGTFFSQTYKHFPRVVSVAFLTKVFEGSESPGDDMEELKWVKPSEIENYFKVPLHKKLKDFLLELV